VELSLFAFAFAFAFANARHHCFRVINPYPLAHPDKTSMPVQMHPGTFLVFRVDRQQ
jgi:hypothetical protein